MWDQTTDKLFLSLREDAVLLFEKKTKKLLYLNEAAVRLFPDAQEGAALTDLIEVEPVLALVDSALSSGHLRALPLPEVPWFPERAMVHAAPLSWDGKSAFAVTIDRRAYGPPSEAMQLMKAVLSASYFNAVRVELHGMRTSVISDKNPLMNTQATFGSFSDYIALYAEAAIHPEDREQFVQSFSVEQLRLFHEANTEPTCTVRRMQDEEYRWASFTLAAVDANIVLLLGKDSNEQHLQQERSDRYRSELESVSLRNQYILANVSGIFRLMLHIDLTSGDTMICSMSRGMESAFSYDKLYQYNEIAEMLMQRAHPDDRAQFVQFAKLKAFFDLQKSGKTQVTFEYRRIHPGEDPDESAKYTRSIITLDDFVDGMPTAAFYTVMDVDAQKRAELSAKRAQETLTTRFNNLVKERFVRFIEYDFSTQIAKCYRIENRELQAPEEVPFGQFFEKLVMQPIHPEDYKYVVKAFLPAAVEKAYSEGSRRTVLDYRCRCGEGWHYVRGEMYLGTDDSGALQAMLYVADIDAEVQNRNRVTKTEHEQLILRRKFGQLVQDSYISIGEVDPDSDTVSHYQLDGGDFVPKKDELPFSAYCEMIAGRIHPSQAERFRSELSYAEVRKAAREHSGQLKGLYLLDTNGSGQYLWCNIGVRFFTNEIGKVYYMTYIQNINDEICGRDAQLNLLSQAKQKLQEQIRASEQARIQKAHVFMNIASNFQLALNQVYSAIDRMENEASAEHERVPELKALHAAYERLSSMTESAKDVLLVENNQLPLLKEPTNLVKLMTQIKQDSAEAFYRKDLRFSSDTSRVTQETILCDRRRLIFLMENIFMKIIRSLPDGSSFALRLSQKPDPAGKNRAVYEFALMTKEKQIAEDIKADLLRPQHRDVLNRMRDVLTSQSGEHQQHNIYLSKRLIALMKGTLDYVQMPDETSAVILQLPFEYVPSQVIFPHRRCYGKRVVVWDSRKTAAMSELEMLRETGMQTEWQAEFSGLVAYLKLARSEGQPYDLIMLRQSELNSTQEDCLGTLAKLVPHTPLLILMDVPPAEHAKPAAGSTVNYIPSPMFRSVLAKALHGLFDGEMPAT